MYKIKEEYIQTVKEEWRYEAFEHAWFKCRAIRQPRWHRCWYVGVPKWHRSYWMNYNYRWEENNTAESEKINWIEVHWWLTYWENYLQNQPEKDLRWFWFDTAHCNDLCICDDGMSYLLENWEYREKKYVIEEIKKLAEQLI
jgi:hypothetical protein